jgi:hypothetical protein
MMIDALPHICGRSLRMSRQFRFYITFAILATAPAAFALSCSEPCDFHTDQEWCKEVLFSQDDTGSLNVPEGAGDTAGNTGTSGGAGGTTGPTASKDAGAEDDSSFECNFDSDCDPLCKKKCTAHRCINEHVEPGTILSEAECTCDNKGDCLKNDGAGCKKDNDCKSTFCCSQSLTCIIIINNTDIDQCHNDNDCNTSEFGFICNKLCQCEYSSP